LRRIVGAARLPARTRVVEIGAGTGNLTEALVEQGHLVTAVEVEPVLSRRLTSRFGDHADVTVVNADARTLEIGTLVDGPHHVVANLPYSVGTRLVVDWLASGHPPISVTVLLQREVVRRMVAKPGEMALLTVLVQSHAEAEALFDVAPRAFRPRPKVDSTLVRLLPLDLSAAERKQVSRRIGLARHGFAQSRKKLRNSIAAGLGIHELTASSALDAAGIDPARRPATVTLAEWDALADAFDLEASHAATSCG
jgi:16S rRNA (adenine1518-N6/adenine1519-N6)-dimethyltransferase